MNEWESDKLGVGVLPAHVPILGYPGHMWLYWTRKGEISKEFRGFYPDDNDFPEDYHPLERWRDYFFDNSARGIRKRDNWAKMFEKKYNTKCKNNCWDMDRGQKMALEFRCFIPPNTDSAPEDVRYSFNTNGMGLDNCVSWAGKVVNEIMENELVRIRHPARIKYVIEDNKWQDK